jgi:predicted TIM-barrel fold metal-dependent hydrolase
MLTSRGGLQALELADEGPNGGVVIEHCGSQQIQ